MKFYLAAKFDRMAEMNVYAQQLRNSGHEVTSRWLLGKEQFHEGVDLIDRPEGLHSGTGDITMLAQPFAMDDHEDIIGCDTLILFTESPEAYAKRGGRHTEFGIALGLGKQLIIIGPRENIFHCLPQVQQFRTWTDCLRELVC